MFRGGAGGCAGKSGEVWRVVVLAVGLWSEKQDGEAVRDTERRGRLINALEVATGRSSISDTRLEVGGWLRGAPLLLILEARSVRSSGVLASVDGGSVERAPCPEFLVMATRICQWSKCRRGSTSDKRFPARAHRLEIQFLAYHPRLRPERSCLESRSAVYGSYALALKDPPRSSGSLRALYLGRQSAIGMPPVTGRM